MREFKRGLKAGIPIALGYLSVSFTFGIMAVSTGMYWWQALLVSMTTVTSAGQLAGIQIMPLSQQYMEMFISQLTINVRYSFMSVSLAQKTDKNFKGIHKVILGFMMTDEIFAVAVREKNLRKSFFAGLGVLPYIGWSVGTLLGAILGGVLPVSVLNAMGIALYAMFIAIVIPDAVKSKAVTVVCVIAIILQLAFNYMPMLNKASGGIAISVCAVVAAIIGALIFPVVDERENEGKYE